ncbi:MAG: hypothetical protein QNJ31_04460 [Candidatus Caenarcaniphilales bacterium]|nr:hypothetical protein [Candidatus Caenarcaniphilales bacterium]
MEINNDLLFFVQNYKTIRGQYNNFISENNLYALSSSPEILKKTVDEFYNHYLDIVMAGEGYLLSIEELIEKVPQNTNLIFVNYLPSRIFHQTVDLHNNKLEKILAYAFNENAHNSYENSSEKQIPIAFQVPTMLKGLVDMQAYLIKAINLSNLKKSSLSSFLKITKQNEQTTKQENSIKS